MTSEVCASVRLTNEKVQFTGSAGTNPEVVFDYHPPVGDGHGYTGLEMLLMSLCACSGTSVLYLLRNMGKHVSGLSVAGRGVRRDTHPMCFASITLEFHVRSDDTGQDELQRALGLAEERYCPVWAMIKGNADVQAVACVEPA